MRLNDVFAATATAKEFLRRVELVIDHEKKRERDTVGKDPFVESPSALVASMKRASLDLTKALAKMRCTQ